MIIASTFLPLTDFDFLIPPNLPLKKGGAFKSLFEKGGFRGIFLKQLSFLTTHSGQVFAPFANAGQHKYRYTVQECA